MASTQNQSKSPFTKQHYLFGILGVLIIAIVLAYGVQGGLLQGNFTVGVNSATGVTGARMRLVPNKVRYDVGEAGTARFQNVLAGTVIYPDGCGKLFYVEQYAADNTYVPAPGLEPCPGTSQSVAVTNGYSISFTVPTPGKYHLVIVYGKENDPATANLASSRFTVVQTVTAPTPTSAMLMY